MKELYHWHPVALSKEVTQKPIQIELHSKKIVLFRNSKNQIQALDDECPHRRMPLHNGRILKDQIKCAYHGICFDKNGNANQEKNPIPNIKAFAYDTYEFMETIWIKPKDSFCSFPYFDLEGYSKIDIFKTEIQAPLELVLDNFTEVEHTPSVHLFLGYDSSKLTEMNVESFTEEDSVRIKNTGPQKKIPSFIRYFLDLKKKNLFVDDWTTYFSPVYSIYEQYWIEGEQKNKNQFRIYVFFTPINSKSTQLFAYTYLKYEKLGHFGFNLFIKLFLKQIVRLEILRDKSALEKIENQDISLKGLKLTRFDRSLGPNRARIEKIYKGN